MRDLRRRLAALTFRLWRLLHWSSCWCQDHGEDLGFTGGLAAVAVGFWLWHSLGVGLIVGGAVVLFVVLASWWRR